MSLTTPSIEAVRAHVIEKLREVYPLHLNVEQLGALMEPPDPYSPEGLQVIVSLVDEGSVTRWIGQSDFSPSYRLNVVEREETHVVDDS